MWLVGVVVDILYWCYRFFYDIAETCWDTFIIPDRIGDWFSVIAWYFYDLRGEVQQIGRWFDDVRSSLWDILSWETIYDKVKSIFFEGKNPIDWVADKIDTFISTYFSWIKDPEFDIWNMIKGRVEELIPIDFVKPWQIWDLIVDKVKELIPEITIPEIPTLESIMEWFKDRFPVIKDLDFDPIGWLSGKMGDALGTFLGIAAWPFLHTVEGFLERLWDEESEEGA